MDGSRIRFTCLLMRYAADILRKDKELLVFTILSGVLCIVCFSGLFYGDLFSHERFSDPHDATNWYQEGKLFLFLFWSYFIITFFNSAVVGSVIMRLRGSNPTLMDGFRMAFSRLPLIGGWALISATFILCMRFIEGKVIGGKWLRLGLEVSWGLATILVIPIIVVEGQDPVRALKTSASLIRQTWGKQLVANFGFGIMQMILTVPAVVGVFFVLRMDYVDSSILLVYLALLALYVVMVFLVITTLETIFKAALYCYARGIETPREILPNIAGAALMPDIGDGAFR